jgi:hypothetical protein
MQRNGETIGSIANLCAEYWTRTFEPVTRGMHLAAAEPVFLEELYNSYQNAGTSSHMQLNIEREMIETGEIEYVGGSDGVDVTVIRELSGAFALALVGSSGKRLPELLSVLPETEAPTAPDYLVYRIFKENFSGFAEDQVRNTFTSAQEQAYPEKDVEAFIKLAKHPNPVARLIVLEIAGPAFAWNAEPHTVNRFLKTFEKEANLMIIRHLTEEAYRGQTAEMGALMRQIQKNVPDREIATKERIREVIEVIESGQK